MYLSFRDYIYIFHRPFHFSLQRYLRLLVILKKIASEITFNPLQLEYYLLLSRLTFFMQIHISHDLFYYLFTTALLSFSQCSVTLIIDASILCKFRITDAGCIRLFLYFPYLTGTMDTLS